MQVVSAHTLKHGIEVEVRPIDGPYLGGWHEAIILEVCYGCTTYATLPWQR